MGIRDYLSSTADTLSGGFSRSRDILSGSASAVAPYLSGAWQSTRGLARVASESAVWTQQAVAERIPDRRGWERLGRLGWRIADHAIDHGTKTYTCGIPVYRIVKEELRKGNRPPQQQEEEEDRRFPKVKKEDAEVAVLKARIERIEKENMELQNLRLKMESVEMRLMQIQEETEEKKKAQKRREDWDPPELVHLI